MSTIREEIIEQHIEENYPNAKIVDYTDADSGLRFYTAAELQNVEEDWFPLCCYRDPARGETVYGGRDHVVHTYTEGETGAGKTTRFVMQSIRALSSMKAKPSFVIVDIHGEIIENLYEHLKKNGYNVKILNCDDPKHSDTYNPFAEMVNACLKSGTLGNEEINRIRKISEIIQPVESHSDPIWEIGARSYTNGLILDKFEDLLNGDIPPECITLYNIIQNHYWLRNKLRSDYRCEKLFSIPHYEGKGASALSVQKMLSVTDNSEKTRSSYFGVIENRYDAFGQPSMYSLSSSNTISISDFINEPTAIVIQSGNTSIGDDLISLLVNEIYSQVVKVGKATASKKLPRNIHCFLDEFANCNIAEGTEFIKMLTTSRKFGMFWHMILQCDAQLERKFNANIGRIIRANCTEIFMGSHDYDTSVRFAKSCGQKTIEDLGSKAAGQKPNLVTVDLMTTEKLSLTEEGWVYVKANRQHILRSYFEAIYNCEEFAHPADIQSVYPENTFDYRWTRFTPDSIPNKIASSQYQVLKFLGKEKMNYQLLVDTFPMYDMEELIRDLAWHHQVNLLNNDMLRSTVDERTFALYTRREEISLGDEEDYYIVHNWDCDGDGSWEDEDEDDENDPDESPWNADTGCGQDMAENIDEWFERPDPKGHMDLAGHFEEVDAEEIRALIEELTCVPESLRSIVEEFSEGTASGSEYRQFRLVGKILKYEIIEEYIRNNDFSGKEQWETGITQEYAQILKGKAFPKPILEAFRDAMLEIKNELTMTNIQEIKGMLGED